MRLEIEGDFSFNLLVLSSGFNLKSVTIPSTYANVNELTLMTMVSFGYTNQLVQRPFYLFKSFPLNRKFSRINDLRYIQGQGYLLIGEHIPVQKAIKDNSFYYSSAR